MRSMRAMKISIEIEKSERERISKSSTAQNLVKIVGNCSQPENCDNGIWMKILRLCHPIRRWIQSKVTGSGNKSKYCIQIVFECPKHLFECPNGWY